MTTGTSSTFLNFYSCLISQVQLVYKPIGQLPEIWNYCIIQFNDTHVYVYM